jgi:chemotaxis regulatin CheY-phosphate phosphatase CheZ
VQDIIPVVEELKVSVDATSEKFPKASKQLDKVTHATEMASTEILNTLETMFAKLEEMTARHNDQQSRTKLLAGTIHAVDAQLTACDPDALKSEQLAKIQAAWGKHRAALLLPEDGFAEALQGLQSNCTNIMMALQVQDITAQQIASVNRMMQSVDQGLNKLMKHFSEVPASAVPGQYDHAHLDIQFDDGADFFGSEDRQKAADELVESIRPAKDEGQNGSSLSK